MHFVVQAPNLAMDVPYHEKNPKWQPFVNMAAIHLIVTKISNFYLPQSHSFRSLFVVHIECCVCFFFPVSHVDEFPKMSGIEWND